MQQVEHTAFEDTVAGRRVVISSDGGRLRLRENTRGPKTKKGCQRYTGAWREPKVLLVYVVDAEGKRDTTFVPVMDATLKGPDTVFALLRSYLQRLEITQADQVLFLADGAPWIWKRVPLLVQALGLATQQVHELLDFYHAVHHLGQVAALRKDWSVKACARWRMQQRRLLLQGQVKQGIAAVQALCRGRHSKAIRKQREYFIKNQSRLAYAKLLALKLPIGSGAIESAVRRVINLRLKGPGLFWCRASAEAVLLLRSYYKSVEDAETDGHFTSCSAGSLIGKMGMRPIMFAKCRTLPSITSHSWPWVGRDCSSWGGGSCRRDAEM